MCAAAETAIWFPFWYELDQSIAVGEVAEFDFFHQPPTHFEHDGRQVFYTGDWSDKCRTQFNRRKLRILSIRNSELGAIQSINTSGLDYTFTMTDGRFLMVEAEETPGLVYDHPEPIRDWRIFVEMEPA